MKNRPEEGMTILEVVIAITILMIGTGFVVQSNAFAFRYLGQQELRQQMIFFAAGAMEATLEGHSQELTNAGMTASSSDIGAELVPGLTPFKVTVSVNTPGISNVEIYNYRYSP